MKGAVRRPEAERRKRELEARQIVITERALDAHIGRGLAVLIEEPVEGEELSIGRAYLQAPEVDGLTVVRARLPAGSMVDVRMTRRNGLDLEGEPLDG
jgi:ribosomal protein S12 methylthiotransferase